MKELLHFLSIEDNQRFIIVVGVLGFFALITLIVIIKEKN
jgi:hypothetical protein